MSSAARFVIVALFVIALVPVFRAARGEDTARPVPARVEDATRPTAVETAHACLDQRDRRAEAGKLVPLAATMHTARARMPGTVVRARLCHAPDGLVYVLTVLARDGKVARITVDAVKGTLIGGL